MIAQAADKPTQAPDSMIKATERKFLPNYCAKGLEGLAADVYDCFHEIKSSDPKQEECLIADMMVFKTIKTLNDRSIALGQTPKYNMPFFTSMEAARRASKFIKASPQFKDYTMLKFATYLATSANIIFKDYVELDKKTNGNCSSFFKP